MQVDASLAEVIRECASLFEVCGVFEKVMYAPAPAPLLVGAVSPHRENRMKKLGILIYE